MKFKIRNRSLCVLLIIFSCGSLLFFIFHGGSDVESNSSPGNGKVGLDFTSSNPHEKGRKRHRRMANSNGNSAPTTFRRKREGAIGELEERLNILMQEVKNENFLIGADALQIEGFRNNVTFIAEHKGIKNSEVLSKLLKANPMAADGLTALIAESYLHDPVTVVDLFLNGISGRSRSFSLTAYFSQLCDLGDVSGLKIYYARIPPSQDRCSVSSDRVNTIARKEGLGKAVMVVENLDLREEKRYSLIGLYPFARDSKDTISDVDLDLFFDFARVLGYENEARSRTAK